MTPPASNRPIRPRDGLAIAASLIALAMVVVYLVLIRAQGDGSPAVWFLLTLLAAAALAGYGARRDAAHRMTALLLAGAALLAIGLLAILSIGLPILVAGGLALAAALRAATAPPRSPRAADAGHRPP